MVVAVILPAVTYRIAIAVSGRGSNMLALGTALANQSSVEVAVVLSDRDCPALGLASERGWATFRLNDYRSATEWLTALEAQRVDLLVLAGYLRLIPAGVVTAMQGRIINVHPALLPRYGGAGMYGERVHRAVLEAGESESGATVHLVDEEFDRGAILGQCRVPVSPDDTPASLAHRVLEAEHRLLPAAVLAAARAGQPVPFVLD